MYPPSDLHFLLSQALLGTGLAHVPATRPGGPRRVKKTKKDRKKRLKFKARKTRHKGR